jgi:D-lyxose ketol-isomerase
MISKSQWINARNKSLGYFDLAGIILTDSEKERIEVTDFGIEMVESIGLQLLTYLNTNRCCAKELILFPLQICPEHRHPRVNCYEGKEETFRCRWGEVYLYVEGDPTPRPNAKIPNERVKYFTVWHEIILHPGEQHTIEPDKLHWFQAGPVGAIVSEFSTRSLDEEDIFTDPYIRRKPVVQNVGHK